MKTACGGCEKKHKARDEILYGNGEHICKCQSRDDNLKIETEIDQIAATSRDLSGSSTEACQSENVQKQEELKSRIIQSIKDLPPMPQVVIEIQQLISDLNSDISQLTAIILAVKATASECSQSSWES